MSLSLYYHLTLWFTVIYTEVCERGFIIQTEQLPSLPNTRIDNIELKLASVRFTLVEGLRVYKLLLPKFEPKSS